MFKGIIVFLLTLMIILFPIPLKITLKYSNKMLGIYIFNKRLKMKSSSKNHSKSKEKKDPVRSFTLNDLKRIIYKIKNLKFKLKLNLNTKLEYGFDDAALVAILYGLIHSSYSYLYLLLINFFNVKNINLNLTPHFKKNNFKIKISSIIYFNIAKIIYMAFVIFICLIKIKHKNKKIRQYKGGNVHG